MEQTKKQLKEIKKISLKTVAATRTIIGGYAPCGYCRLNQLCRDCDGSEFYEY